MVGQTLAREEVVLWGWMRVKVLAGMVGERGVRPGGGEGRATIAVAARRKLMKARIFCFTSM